VGIVGLQGSGADVVPGAIFGARPATGVIRVAGVPLVPSPARCIERGMILVAGDRRASLVGSLGVLENATLSSLRRLSRFGWIGDEVAAAQPALSRLRVVCASLEAPVDELSGGNQQKVAFARCLVAEPRVLLLDEPTRGIDVGARGEVHRLVRELTQKGVALLLSSSDLEETFALCDRVVVLSRGRVVERFERAAFDRRAVLAAALGSAA
jgi:ABC-type sugar transport system ATPase subunit